MVNPGNKSRLDLISEYGSEYLICDGRMPIVAQSFYEECLLYGLGNTAREKIKNQFNSFTNKNLSDEEELALLSGGQKVILMALLALASPAPRILFRSLFDNLDLQNRSRLHALLEDAEDKDILYYAEQA